MAGWLIAVGTGLRPGQLTFEADGAIRDADVVFCVVATNLTLYELRQLNANVVSLSYLYEDGKPRKQTYEEMIDIVLNSLRDGNKVCFATYGHPGVFAYPTHESIRRAKKEGYQAKMIPGISAEDCLFADLSVDPGEYGCQSFDSSDFLAHNRQWDNQSLLIIWQPAATGEPSLLPEGEMPSAFPLLQQTLIDAYGPDKEVILYEAAIYPLFEANIVRVPLGKLEHSQLSATTTLVVLPTKTTREIKHEFALQERKLATRVG